MSGNGDQIEHLIEHIVEETVSAKLIEKHIPDLTSRLMRQIGTAILKAGNESELIHLDKAIAQAKQLRDGSAIFLFKEHNPANRAILFADFSNASQRYFKIISLDQDNLAKSVVYDLTSEQTEEVTRQICAHFGAEIKNSFTLSIALIANVPEGYEFWYSPDLKPVTDSDICPSNEQERTTVDTVAWKDTPSADSTVSNSDQVPAMPTPID